MDPAPSSNLPRTPSRPAAHPFPYLNLSRRLVPRRPLLQVPAVTCGAADRRRDRVGGGEEGKTDTRPFSGHRPPPPCIPLPPTPLHLKASSSPPPRPYPVTLVISFQAGSESEGLLRNYFSVPVLSSWARGSTHLPSPLPRPPFLAPKWGRGGGVLQGERLDSVPSQSQRLLGSTNTPI